MRTGGEGFLVRLAGFAEVHVDVDQAGAGHESPGVDFFGALLRRGRQRGNKLAVADKNIAEGVPLGSGINYAGVFDPERGHGLKLQHPSTKRP